MIRVYKGCTKPNENDTTPVGFCLKNYSSMSGSFQRDSLNALSGQSVYQSDVEGKAYARDDEMPIVRCRGIDENDLYAMKQMAHRKLMQAVDVRKKKVKGGE